MSAATHTTPSRPKISAHARRQRTYGSLFLLPWTLGFFAFQLLPILFTFFLSFTDYTGATEFKLGNFNFVGLSNYKNLLIAPDALPSMGVTLKFALIGIPLGLAVPLILALLVNSRRLIASNFFRTLFYLPSVIPVVAGAIIFNGVLNAQSGWLNLALQAIGIDNPPRWFSDPIWAGFALNLLAIWGVGNGMIILLAALQGVPTELYEAATVDGAGPITKFFYITVPMISPVIFYNLTIGVIVAFQYFVPALLIGSYNGNPQGALLFFPTVFYREGFIYSRMGYASVLAIVIFVVTMAATGLLFFFGQRLVYYASGETSWIGAGPMAITKSIPGGSPAKPVYRRWWSFVREALARLGVTGLGLLVLTIFLLPLAYVVSTAFKLDLQMTTIGAPAWPAEQATYSYDGGDYPLYNVPTEDGSTRRLALVHPYRERSDMVDPAHPEQGVFNVEGRWRTWEAIYRFAPKMKNFQDAWEQVNFPRLFRNSLLLSGISTIGTLIACILVAYGFTRFPLPGKNILFVILISTIVLPPQATIIPLYILFSKIGWTQSWLPLLVPAFFANAYDVFLLRQYFMSIPRELDEAAMLDGASPMRILISIIVPQAIPAITAVTIFHFFFVWNQYFEPLVYLLGREDLYPVSVGIGQFVTTFSTYPGRSAATAVLAMLLPAVIFFLAQRQFMQGIVITGVEK